ncbi:hypothetical protein Hanom_Chr07g00614251 [Helianthus anomalus]
MPPPRPPVEQQTPLEPLRRRMSNAQMFVRGGVRISTPWPSSGSHYPPLQEEEPQMGGPSDPLPEINSVPLAPPLGFVLVHYIFRLRLGLYRCLGYGFTRKQESIDQGSFY